MDLKLLLVVSALGTVCVASIQDPYIHDSAEDQIAMESGPAVAVVVAPPHLKATAAETIAEDVPKPADAHADAVIVDIQADNEVVKPEPGAKKPAAIPIKEHNDEPTEPVAVPAPQPSLGLFSMRQPALSPLLQMSLLSRLQLQSQLQYGAPLAGYGASPVILLQPIIIPVPVSAPEAEKQPNSLNEQLMFRQPARPRPLSLMDVLQGGYYGL